MNQGDYVTRKSYGGDVVFRIERIVGGMALLRGVELRLMADAPLADLQRAEAPAAAQNRDDGGRFRQAVEKLHHFRKKVLETTMRDLQRTAPRDQWSEFGMPGSFFELPGKVLHLDGDANYLRKSMALYKELRVPVLGFHISEAAMAEALQRLLPRVQPDIVVITGHDGMYKRNGESSSVYSLSNYKNSAHFVEAIRAARRYERSLDDLIIVAGACQSYFEALLQAGANFASSPARILIHAMDPVHIASKLAYTSMKDTVCISDIYEHTMTGTKGIGGIETRGCFRIGAPNVRKNPVSPA